MFPPQSTTLSAVMRSLKEVRLPGSHLEEERAGVYDDAVPDPQVVPHEGVVPGDGRDGGVGT